MVKLIVYFIVVGALIFGSVWLADRPGAVTLEWQGWRIDTTVPVLLGLVAFVAVALTILLRLWAYIKGTPRRIMDKRRDSKRSQGLIALSRGYQAIAAGDAKSARRLLKEADAKLGDPSATLMLAAQTAELEGNDGDAAAKLHVLAENPETRLAALRSLVARARAEGNLDDAVKKARDAHGLNPDAKWATREVLDLECALGNWAEADNALADANRAGLLDKADYSHKRAVILAARAENASDAGNHDEAIKWAREAYDINRSSAPVAVLYARLLVEGGKDRKASAVLEDTWAHAPHPDLGAAYLALDAKKDALSLAKRAETLASRNPDHPESLLIVAETALEAELWGRARANLKTLAEAARPTRRVVRLMAQLEQSERKDVSKANDWLKKVPGAAPNPAWRCSSCGTETDVWSPHCPSCRTFDSIVWSEPSGNSVVPLATGTVTDTHP